MLRNAEVYAPQPQGSCDVLVAGPRVAWVGPAGTLPKALPAQVIELSGQRLVPGFVDPHVHVTGGGGESGPAGRLDPLPVESCLHAGVTTVIGVLGTDDVTRGPEELLARINSYRAQGISAWCWMGGYHLPPRTLLGSVERDLVFLEPVIGVGEIAVSDHRSSQPAPESLRQVAAQAYVGGMLGGKAGRVHVHMGGGGSRLDPLRAALAGSELPTDVFYPTHVNRSAELFRDALEFAAGASPIDLTAYPEAAPLPGDGLSVLAALRQLRGRLDQPGTAALRVTVSSDAGGSLPAFDARGTLVSYEVGQPSALTAAFRSALHTGEFPLEWLLTIFSTNAADILRLPGKGRIRPGGDADLLVLQPNGEIGAVMAQGRWRMGPFGT